MCRCCGRRWGDWGTCSVGGGAGGTDQGDQRRCREMGECIERDGWKRRLESRVLGKEGRGTVWTGLGLGLSPLLCIQRVFVSPQSQIPPQIIT